MKRKHLVFTIPLLIMLSLSVSCTTAERVEEEKYGYALTNPPLEKGPAPAKPPYLPGMEPEGTFRKDTPTIDEIIASLEAEGKLKAPEPEPVPEETAAEESPVEETPLETAPAEETSVTEEAAPEVPTEPVIEEPVIEECAEDSSLPEVAPAVEEEPVVEEPVTEEPVAEETAEPEPTEEAPVTEPKVTEGPKAEDTAETVDIPPLEEPVIEEGAAEEPAARKVPAWVNELPVSDTSLYFAGTCERYTKLMSGVMLARMDAEEQAKSWMEKTATEIAETVIWGQPYPEGLRKDKKSKAPLGMPLSGMEESWTDEAGKIWALLRVDKISMAEWMMKVGDKIFRENSTDEMMILEWKESMKPMVMEALSSYGR